MGDILSTLTARVQIDKEESYKQALEALKFIKQGIDKNTITYTLSADATDIEKTLREIQNRKDLEIGTKISLVGDTKTIQDMIDKLFSGGIGGGSNLLDKLQKDLKSVTDQILETTNEINNLQKK